MGVGGSWVYHEDNGEKRDGGEAIVESRWKKEEGVLTMGYRRSA